MLSKSLVTLLLSSGIASALPSNGAAKPDAKGLKWGNCTDDFFPNEVDLQKAKANSLTCANLEVPLDYTNSDSESIQLQLVRWKGTKGSSKGSILFNPGGPGASGLTDIVDFGEEYDKVLEGQFDLISFDPRGVGKTIPFTCPKADTTSSKLARRANITVELPHPDMYEQLLSQWEEDGDTAERCYEANKKTGRFISTAFVARDMVQIIEALDEDKLLRYWGTSYGTLLGQTFAAMFPDRIDRMLLDGNQAASDYYDGYDLLTLFDTSRAISHAFSECIDAGVDKCSLANHFGPKTTTEELMVAYSDLLQDLLGEGSTKSAEYYHLLKSGRHGDLYSPGDLLYTLSIIKLGLQGNWTVLDTIIENSNAQGKADDSTEDDLAEEAITCLDAAFRADNPEDVYSLTRAQTELSPSFPDGPLASRVCPQWKFDAAERYEGHFRGINTSFPILFANGRYDPITPLVSAFEASVAFKGSRVLQYNGIGHGALSHPSKCSNKVIRDYFLDGVLPKVGVECSPDQNGILYALATINATSF